MKEDSARYIPLLNFFGYLATIRTKIAEGAWPDEVP